MKTVRQNVEHTPTPWTADGMFISDRREVLLARTDVVTFRDTSEANATFIVRCVNSHAQLLAALLKLHPRNSHSSNVDHEEADINNCDFCQLITKAEGK